MDNETHYLVFRMDPWDSQVQRTRTLDEARKYVFERKAADARAHRTSARYAIETRVTTTTAREEFPR